MSLYSINRTPSSETELDKHSLFQSGIKISADRSKISPFLPYPQLRRHDSGEEQQTIDLLYRNEKVYASGHGCAGTWETGISNQRPFFISAEPLPWFETPSVTSELIISDPSNRNAEKSVKIPLQLLAYKTGFEKGIMLMSEMLEGYEEWIENLMPEIDNLSGKNSETASDNLKRCKESLKRMRTGISLLKENENSEISKAFRLTNRAMLMQALQSGIEKRAWRFDGKSKRSFYDRNYEEISLESDQAKQRAWSLSRLHFFL